MIALSYCRVISRKAISSTTNRTYYSPLTENFSKNWQSRVGISFSDCIAFFVRSILESFVSKEGLSLAKVMIALAGLCTKVLSLIVGFYLLVLQGLPLFLLVFHFTRVHISPKTKIGFDLISNSPWSTEHGRCSANNPWVFFIITLSV